MEVTNLIKSIIDDFFSQNKNNVLYLTLSQDILQTFDSQLNNDAYIIDLNNDKRIKTERTINKRKLLLITTR